MTDFPGAPMMEGSFMGQGIHHFLPHKPSKIKFYTMDCFENFNLLGCLWLIKYNLSLMCKMFVLFTRIIYLYALGEIR